MLISAIRHSELACTFLFAALSTRPALSQDRARQLLPGGFTALPDAPVAPTLLGIAMIPASRLLDVETLAAAYPQFVTRAHARGVKVIAATMMPFECVPSANF